jgi:TnpA family transposase
LTAEQREEFMQIPSDSDWDLGTYYTFSQYDLDIINNHRRDHNRLGFAVQLAVLRFPGWSLTDLKMIPDSMLSYIAKQVGVEPDVFPLYAQREPTRREHMEEIRQAYGYRNFTLREYRSTSQIMLKYALENGNAVYLLRTAIDELRKQKIILPAMTTIERVVWEARQRAEEKISKLLISSLTREQIEKMERILSPMPESSKTYLAWLREIPGSCSPDAFLKVIEKLEYVRDLRLQIDIKGIHPNRLRSYPKLERDMNLIPFDGSMIRKNTQFWSPISLRLSKT